MLLRRTKKVHALALTKSGCFGMARRAVETARFFAIVGDTKHATEYLASAARWRRHWTDGCK